MLKLLEICTLYSLLNKWFIFTGAFPAALRSYVLVPVISLVTGDTGNITKLIARAENTSTKYNRVTIRSRWCNCVYDWATQNLYVQFVPIMFRTSFNAPRTFVRGAFKGANPIDGAVLNLRQFLGDWCMSGQAVLWSACSHKH